MHSWHRHRALRQDKGFMAIYEGHIVPIHTAQNRSDNPLKHHALSFILCERAYQLWLIEAGLTAVSSAETGATGREQGQRGE